jgi:hypothetical protein
LVTFLFNRTEDVSKKKESQSISLQILSYYQCLPLLKKQPQKKAAFSKL